MQWAEFQDTADRLAQGTAEGDWRSAASRAYYAVFHFGRELLHSYGLDIGRGGQAHFNLYTGLWNCGFPGVAAVARRIDDPRIQRTLADYELARPLLQPDAVYAVREARAIVTDLRSLLSRLSSAQVVDGARQHLLAIGRLGKKP